MSDTPETDAAAAEEFLKRHRCDCETCARTSAICTATASSIILEALHNERRALLAEAKLKVAVEALIEAEAARSVRGEACEIAKDAIAALDQIGKEANE